MLCPKLSHHPAHIHNGTKPPCVSKPDRDPIALLTPASHHSSHLFNKDKLMLESILSVFNYQPEPALPSDLQAPDIAGQARLSPDPGLSLSSRPTWSRIRSGDKRWRDKIYDYLPPAQLAGSSQSGLTPCYNSDKLKRCSLKVT